MIVNRKTSIGLDINDTSICVAELRVAPKGLRLVRAASTPTPSGSVLDGKIADPRTVAGSLKKLLQSVRLNAKGKRVVVSLPVSAVVARVAQLPVGVPHAIQEQLQQEIKRYNETNSSLQTLLPGNFVRIGGLAFDPQGNLWMSNSSVSEPISVLKPDGTWKSFRCNNLISDYSTLGDVLMTQSGHLWVIVPRGNGLFAMNNNLTVDDTSDDQYRKVSVEDRFGKVITNDVRSFAEDKNGNLWLGTNQGVLVMYSPYRLFTDGELYAQPILIPRKDGSGLADPLLGTQIVSTIEVDGANRKWLGTAGGGVYLVSEVGVEGIHHFNSMNSPLLSDNIIDICVDGISGEVFFGTDKGVISFKGDALSGSSMYNEVVVYPNPVRETYEGPVAIKGLVANTNVKITDIGGNLVFETESLGGQAIWDGKNFRGDRVATGVYMIYLASPYGSFSHVTKLLFIH